MQTFSDVKGYRPPASLQNNVAQAAAQPESRGFIADAITNMINSGWKSLRTVPEFMLSYLPQKIGGGIKNVVESAQGTAKPIQSFADIQYKPILLNEEEGKQLNVDPVRQYMGSSAELGSYILPGAMGAAKGVTALARIGSAAGRSAAGGALGGLGSGLKQDLTVPELLGQAGQGAVVGGALGGVLQGGSEAFKWLGNKIKPETLQKGGEKLQAAGTKEIYKGGEGLQTKAEPGMNAKLNKDIANFETARKWAGLDNQPVSDMNIEKSMEAVGNARESAVTNMNVQIPASQFEDKLKSKIVSTLGTSQEETNKLAGNIMDILKKGKNLTADEATRNTFLIDANDLHGLTQNDIISSARDAFYKAKGNLTKLKDPLIAEKFADDTAKSILSNADPVYKEANQIFNSYYRQLGNLSRTTNRGVVSITAGGKPTVGAQLQPFVERKIGELGVTTGKGISGLGNLGEKVSQSQLGNILQNVGQTAGNVVNRAIPVVAGPLAVAGMQPQQQGDILPTGAFDQNLGGGDYTSPGNVYTTPFSGETPNPEIQTANPYEKLPQLVQAGFTVKEAMDILKGSTSNIPATVKTQFAALQSGLDQIQQLSAMIEQGKGYFGRGQDTIGSALHNIFPDANRSALQSRLTTTLYNVARAAHGAGVMSNQDIEMFKKDLAPSFGDTPEEAQAKLEQAYAILEDKMTALNNQYQQ